MVLLRRYTTGFPVFLQEGLEMRSDPSAYERLGGRQVRVQQTVAVQSVEQDLRSSDNRA